MKTFLVDSLFDSEKTYIAVCSDATGEIIRHIRKGEPVEEEPKKEITSYNVVMEANYPTWERGKQIVHSCYTYKQAMKYINTWKKRGFKFSIEPVYETVKPEPENKNQCSLF